MLRMKTHYVTRATPLHPCCPMWLIIYLSVPNCYRLAHPWACIAGFCLEAFPPAISSAWNSNSRSFCDRLLPTQVSVSKSSHQRHLSWPLNRSPCLVTPFPLSSFTGYLGLIRTWIFFYLVFINMSLMESMFHESEGLICVFFSFFFLSFVFQEPRIKYVIVIK